MSFCSWSPAGKYSSRRTTCSEASARLSVLTANHEASLLQSHGFCRIRLPQSNLSRGPACHIVPTSSLTWSFDSFLVTLDTSFWAGWSRQKISLEKEPLSLAACQSQLCWFGGYKGLNFIYPWGNKRCGRVHQWLPVSSNKIMSFILHIALLWKFRRP